MASLNLSTNGPSITKSYQSVVNSPLPSGQAATSPTYGQWVVLSVQAPLANAFQQETGGKESVLRVQSTGEGELLDLIDEFSDGRIQFAFVKVKDPNTALPKNALIGWCGEGVPERTKGYFTSHLAAVAKVLHVTARSDRDLTPEGIVQKVSDASGSKYSGGGSDNSSFSSGPPPPVSSKPAFTPTRVGGSSSSFNPLAASQHSRGGPSSGPVDEDGWGEDAPQVTRRQLEKVPSAYQPTKVNMAELTKQKQEPSRFSRPENTENEDQANIVKGGYQPVGKIDIAALRRQAQDSGPARDDRPTTVKGAYEPVGKVDIAAIRARAQPRPDASPSSSSKISPAGTGRSEGGDVNAALRASPDVTGSSNQSERLTSLPKPKVGNKFGTSSSNFAGTKPPTPGGLGFDSKPTSAAPPVGAASRTFADEGGKTPAQLWAEKKARERGLSGASDTQPSPKLGSTSTGDASKNQGEWKSGYAGKSWAPVATTTTGRSAASSISQQRTGPDEASQDEQPTSPAGGVGALRDRFKGATPMGAPSQSSTAPRSAPSPPPLDNSSKPTIGGPPSGGMAIPGLPSRPRQSEPEDTEAPELPTPPAVPRSPTPPTPPAMRPSSPIRVAMPVGRGQEHQVDAPDERFSPPPIPADSLARQAPREEDLTDEPAAHDPARGAGAAAAAATFGQQAVDDSSAAAHRSSGGTKRALVQYDYEKGEDNELELREGEYITDIDMVDEDWWMGRDSRGETGLFPSNYVELVGDDDGDEGAGTGAGEEPDEPERRPIADAAPPAGPAPGAAGTAGQKDGGPSAVALYDYEAAEDNELSFAEGSKITGLEFPDDDWWFGHQGGKEGLFPANYVQLDE
ncbi:MAG: hypothetical protein M1817_002468 [Caeruleum heppii]|nr:MAG: hypothetical protein M1817_002468 [Caeruleum heppii]